MRGPISAAETAKRRRSQAAKKRKRQRESIAKKKRLLAHIATFVGIRSSQWYPVHPALKLIVMAPRPTKKAALMEFPENQSMHAVLGDQLKKEPYCCYRRHVPGESLCGGSLSHRKTEELMRVSDLVETESEDVLISEFAAIDDDIWESQSSEDIYSSLAKKYKRRTPIVNLIDGERWAVVREGHYAVSSHGRVMMCVGNSRKDPGTFLTARIVNGYHSVVLRGGTPGVRAGLAACRTRVHLLMAEAFLGPCPEGFIVVHRDGNQYRNRIENLEYRKITK